MREPSERDRFQIEFSDSAREVLSSAFASTNPEDAIRQLVRLLDGEVILRCEVVEYSSSTGKPASFGWKPFRRWDGKLWLDFFGQLSSLDKDKPLYIPLLTFLPIGKTTVVEVNNKKFVVRHVPSRLEGSWQNGGTVPSYIEFTEAN
jgi:hypothetical protein